MNEEKLEEYRYEEERKEKERRYVSRESRTKSSSTIQSELRLTREVRIPVVRLEKPKIPFRAKEIDYRLEKLKHLERLKKEELMYPKFKVSPPKFEFLSMKLDLEFKIKERQHIHSVPKLNLLKPIIEFLDDPLDTNYEVRKQKIKIQVPNVALRKPVILYETTQLNSDFPTLILVNQIRHEESIDERRAEIQETISLSSDESLEGETFQDPLEIIFKELGGVGGVKSGIRSVEPLVILFKDSPDDNYIQMLEALLLRLYREKYGGYPEVKKLSLREDWNKIEIERWIDEGKLFIINLDSERVNLDKELLADRLWAIFSRKCGIIIFYTRNNATFEKYENILNEIVWRHLNLRASIIKITPRKLSYEEKLRLISLLFGFADIREEIPIDSMDVLLNIGAKKYDEKLKEVEYQYCDVLGLVKLGENESEEHLRGKAFILHCLVKRLERDGKVSRDDPKTIKDIIKTEEPIEGVIVDIHCDGENYEFETLFEEGFKGIHEKLRNYEEHRVSNVKIVVEPITAFLHAKEFAEVMRVIDKMYPNLKVEFLTFDIQNEELIPLKKYLREVRIFTRKKYRKLLSSES